MRLPGALRRRPWLVALATYCLVTVVCLAGSIRPGHTLVPADAINGVSPYRRLPGATPAHNPIVSDAALQFFPLFRFYAAEVREGRLPQWNPRTLSGTAMSPNGYFATVYPPSLLVRWLDPFDAYDLYVVLHLVLAAMGCYALARRLGASATAALVGGLLGLSATMWIHWSLHLGHLTGMVWLPLVLAATHLAVTHPSPRSIVALAVPFGRWWLGGNPQFCYYGTLVLAGATLVFLAGRLRRCGWSAAGRSVVVVAAGLGLGALLAAPTLMPTLAVSDDVVRSREPVSSTAATHLRAPELAEFLVPEVSGSPIDRIVYRPELFGGTQLDSPFVGVTTLVLVAAAVGAGRRARTLIALLGLAGGVVVLAYTGPLHHLLHAALPGYDRFRASSRWLAVVPALAVPVAAVGLTTLLGGSRRARVVSLVASGIVLASLAVLAAMVLFDSPSPRRFMAPRLALAALPAIACGGAAWVAARRPRVAILLVAAGALVDVGGQLPRWYPSVRQDTAYPAIRATDLAAERGGRLYRVGPITNLPSVPPNIPMAYGLDDAQGQAVLFPKLVDRYLRTIEDYGTFTATDNTAPSLSVPARVGSPAVKALDVRTVIVDYDPPPPEVATLLDAGDPVVYGTESFGPALVVAEAHPSTEDKMWESVADPAWDPRRTAAVVGLATPARGTGGEARAVRLRPADETWRVTAPAGGLLRVSAAWHEGWHATVDGRATPVLRADGMFRSIVVPPGAHDVRFRFTNSDEMLGRRLALAGLVALLGLWAAGPVVSRIRRA